MYYQEKSVQHKGTLFDNLEIELELDHAMINHQ
jgi:hypothetical protein